MASFILLATEAAEAHGRGFGLNFNLLETNLINLTVVIALLVYFGRKFLGNILVERTSEIEKAIQDAERRSREAATALVTQQQKLEQAKQEADQIKAAAEVSAQAAREAILAQAQEEIERMKASAAQDLSAEEERIITSLRQRVATLALQKVEAQLGEQVNESMQKQLIDRSIAMLS